MAGQPIIELTQPYGPDFVVIKAPAAIIAVVLDAYKKLNLQNTNHMLVGNENPAIKHELGLYTADLQRVLEANPQLKAQFERDSQSPPQSADKFREN